MKRAFAIILTLAFSTITGPAQAQQEIRPGLWQHDFDMKSESGEMEKAMREVQQQLESMPPEQRQMMEQMMAKQGVQLGTDTQSVKVCISEETAARGFVPQDNDDCKHEVVERGGNTVKVKFNCTGNPPRSGEGKFTITSPTAFTGNSVIDTTVNGKAERMTVKQTGKWLSSDCGNLKAK